MAADGSLFNRSITIHSSARESVCLYTRHAVTNSWKRRTGGKLCAAKLVILHTLRYVCCNSSCRMVYKVVSMTQKPHLCSSCPSEIFLGYSYETGSGLVYLAKVDYCH